MTGFKGTPGPWEATERHDYREIIGPRINSSWYGRKEVWAVAYIDTDLDEAVQDANARLIAAAPCVVKALQDYRSQFGQCLEAHGIEFSPGQIAAEQNAVAALSRALGEGERS